MTDSWLMEADCIHGNTWYECERCEENSRLDAKLRSAHEGLGPPATIGNDG